MESGSEPLKCGFKILESLRITQRWKEGELKCISPGLSGILNPGLGFCILVNSLDSLGGEVVQDSTLRKTVKGPCRGWIYSNLIVIRDFPWLKIPLMLQTDYWLQKFYPPQFFLLMNHWGKEKEWILPSITTTLLSGKLQPLPTFLHPIHIKRHSSFIKSAVRER